MGAVMPASVSARGYVLRVLGAGLPILAVDIRDQFTPMTRSRSHLKDTQADSSLWYDWWDLSELTVSE
jgi:hypothetical protein